MHSESELKAIETIEETLNGLEGEERLVVLVRLIERFSLEEEMRELFSEVSDKIPQVEEPLHPVNTEPVTIASFNSPSDIAAFATPRRLKDRTLVIAAYLQIKNDKEELTAYEINKALAEGGHRSSNITATLASIMETEKERPLIVELHHSDDRALEEEEEREEAQGKTPQEETPPHSRKRYLVTEEGLRRVQKMLTEFEEE